MWTKVLCCLLVVVMLVAGLVSCTEKEKEHPNTTDDGTTPNEVTLDPNSEEAKLLPAEEDLGPYTYTILAPKNEEYDLEFYITNRSDHQNHVVSSALYAREQLMFDRYHVEMRLLMPENPLTTLRQYSMNGDYYCDASMLWCYEMFSAAQEGFLVNLLDHDDQLNLSASYWDQNIQEQYRVNDMLFCLEGDYSIYDEMLTMVIVYNQTVYRKNNLDEKYGSLNTLVKEKKWTYSTMMEMIKGLGRDSNGDGVYDERDEWGLVTEVMGPYYFFLGCGLRPISNNNGVLTNNLRDDGKYQQIYDIVEKIYGETGISNKNPDVLIADVNKDVSHIAAGDIWGAASDVFKYDRALFRSTAMKTIFRLDDMESEYGLLPIPMLLDGQTEYHTMTNGLGIMPLTISRYAKDLDKALKITERLAYHSRYGNNTLYQALYDHLNYNRLGKTKEDVETLETLFASKYYDIDSTLSMTGLEATIRDMVKKGSVSPLASTIKDIADRSETQVGKLVENLEKGFSGQRSQ